jgi:hypothetical protein
MLRGLILSLILIAFLSPEIQGQTLAFRTDEYTIQFKGTPLKRALQEFVKLTNADLIYDPAFELDHEVFLTAEDESAQSLLKMILDDSGYDFIILSSGTFVIVKEVEQKKRRGNLKGIITDKSTGSPIEFASIYLAEAGSGTFSNLDGTFTLTDLLEGKYTLQINHTGYRPLELNYDMRDPKGGNTGLVHIELEPRVFLGNELVVNGSHRPLGISRNKAQTAENLNRFNIQPGSNLLFSTQYFSGLGYDLGSQQLSVQGSGSGDHALTLDGVPVYDPYSISLISSAFSPYAIDKINIEKAGFSASDGSLLAGRVDVQQRYSATGSRQVKAQSEPFSSNLTATSPVNIAGTPIQVDLTGRISMQELIPNQPITSQLNEWDRLDPLLQNFLMGSDGDIAHYDVANQNNDFGFYDLHITASERKKDFKETSFSAYLGGSDVRADLLSERNTLISDQPSLVYTRENAQYHNSLIQLSHRDFSNAKTVWDLQAYYSSSWYSNQYIMQNNGHFGNTSNTDQLFNDLVQLDAADENRNRNFIRELGFKGSINYSINSRNQIELGLNPRYFDYHVEFSDLFYLSTIDQSQVLQLGSYIESRSRIRDNISLETGIRFTSLEMENLFAEPRASVQFDLPNSRLGYSSIQVSGGIYRQFVNRFGVSNIGPSSLLPQYNFWLPSNADSEIPLSLHLAMSYKIETDMGLNIHTEAFYKEIRRGLSLNFPALFTDGSQQSTLHNQDQYLQTYSGFARGYALTLSKQFDEAGLFVEAIYERTLSQIRIENQFNNELMPTQWNEPHRVKLFSRWRISQKFEWVKTALWVPQRFRGFRDAYYNFLPQHSATNFGDYDMNDPSQVQLPYFFNLSTGLQYTQLVKSSSIRLRLDLQNVTNRRNVMDYGLTPFVQSGQDIEFRRYARRLPGLIPTFSIELTF